MPFNTACSYGEGSYAISYDGVEIASGGEYTSLESTAIGSCPPSVTPAPTPAPTVACEEGFASFSLYLLTDAYGYEISWSLEETCGNSVVLSGISYASSTEYFESYCIEEGFEYVFTIYDTAFDGICKFFFCQCHAHFLSPSFYCISVVLTTHLLAGCGYGEGSYTISYNGFEEGSGGEYTDSESIFFGSCLDTTPLPTEVQTPAPTPSCDSGSNLFSLELQTDNFGSEVTWILINDCSGVQIANNGPFDDDALYFDYFCLDAGNQYTFTIFDSASDGICKSWRPL